MPLARFQLRNEFGLGKPELYMEADNEDPKAVLDSIAVAGLVGILRQLGDLAEFAAEVFHGLQEQVTVTASRSHGMMVRVQHIEAALPPLEKRVLVQTSHLHFAYTSGSEWHVRIQNEQHHFIDNDLPRFIMDSYEECRDPPRLHFLDRFDTGGPGSCLSRYSDPTFFRRVSAKFDERNIANMRRDKRGRKFKKKKPLPKNGEYSGWTSMSKSSGRMQFSSPVDNGQTSPAVSVDDARSKFGMGDGIYSFGSRSDSGYIECRFDQNENELIEERISHKSSSSMRIQHEDSTDSTDSVSKDEKNLPVENSAAQSTSQGPVASNASSVTWDEKTEILEPIDQKIEVEKSMAIISAYSDVDEQEEDINILNVNVFSGEYNEDSRSETILLENSFNEIEREDDICGVDDRSKSILLENSGCSENEADNYVVDNRPMPILLENFADEIEGEPDNYIVDDIPNSILLKNQADDVDSEPDSYVDALNTIESESETDDYQMKREMSQHLSEVEESVTRSAVPEPMSQSSVFSISGIKSNGEPSIASNKEMPSELGELRPRESSSVTQIPEASGGVDNSDCFPSNMFERSDLHVGSNSKIESDGSVQPPSGSIPSTNEIPSHFSDSPMKLAAANFWTNGGLLGLQPSKPVDFAPSNNGDAPIKYQDSSADPGDYNLVSNSNGDKTSSVYENCDDQRKEVRSNHPTSFLIDKDSQSNKKTALVSSLADLYARYDKSCNPDPNNKDASISGNSITLVSRGSAVPVARTRIAVPDAPTGKVAPVESRKESDENLSGVFGLSQRLFANSFCKKISLIDDVNLEPPSSAKARIMEQDHYAQHNSTYPTSLEKNTGEKFEVRSLISSLPPSPPLEHMKISFHPVNDFETSKLGLKFSFDKNRQESIRDMFASFQLVPETSVGLHDLGFDSDDDTFYRSSPCTSDGCLSHSDSNSERWESGGTDQVDDASCRISSCAPTPLEQVGLDRNVNVVEEGQSYKTSICGPSLNLPSYDSFESLPKLPENNGDTDRQNTLAPDCSGPSIPPPPRLRPAEWRVSTPQTNMVKEEEQVSVVLNHEPQPEYLLSRSVQEQPQQVNSGQHKIAQDIIKVTADRKALDEKDDFLHQIRTKSFNLRRTSTVRDTNAATSPPPLNANVKVSVILEKANAIRQAVASDDDNWSDT